MNEKLIIKTYEQEGSIRATAAKLGITHTKARKVLLTNGMYETELTNAIANMWNQGMRYDEIAQALSISKSWVYANTPYEKGMYDSDTPTKNAINIRRYKEKKRGVAEGLKENKEEK